MERKIIILKFSASCSNAWGDGGKDVALTGAVVWSSSSVPKAICAVLDFRVSLGEVSTGLARIVNCMIVQPSVKQGDSQGN